MAAQQEATKSVTRFLNKSSLAKVTNAFGGVSWVSGVNLAVSAFGVYSDVKEGRPFTTALAREIGINIFANIAPHVFWGVTFARLGVALGTGMYYKIRERQQWYRQMTKMQPSFTYVDTQAAYTMRQAAVRAIQGSKLNARSALGNEARLMSGREAYNTL